MLKARSQCVAILFSLLALWALAACTEEGSSLVADGGIRGTGKSVGPVSGFGSVIVNGTRFNTDSTDFIVNGEASRSQASLAEGMVVVVDINAEDEDRADRIFYDDDVRGPLEGELNPELRQLEILDHLIRYDSATVFRGLSLAELAELLARGETVYVSVSGWRLSTGEFLASYVSSRAGFTPGVDTVRIWGEIDDFNLPAETLEIGPLTVDYGQTPEVIMDRGRSQLLATDEGSVVVVEGQLDQVGGVLTAQRIEQKGSQALLENIDGDRIRLEGSIRQGLGDVPSGTFEINGIKVRVNPSTALEGITAAGLKEGARVLIEGVGDRQATVVAKQIWTREPETEVEAEIQQIEVTDNPREGWVEVGGVWVKVTLSTIVVGEWANGNTTNLQFSDLREGNAVAVSGIARDEERGGYIEAVKLERQETNRQFVVVGRAGGKVRDGELRVLGMKLKLTGDTRYGDDLDEDSIAPGDLLAIAYEIDANGLLSVVQVDRRGEPDDLEIRPQEDSPAPFNPGNGNGRGGPSDGRPGDGNGRGGPPDTWPGNGNGISNGNGNGQPGRPEVGPRNGNSRGGPSDGRPGDGNGRGGPPDTWPGNGNGISNGNGNSNGNGQSGRPEVGPGRGNGPGRSP